jgi:hypothetical protein
MMPIATFFCSLRIGRYSPHAIFHFISPGMQYARRLPPSWGYTTMDVATLELNSEGLPNISGRRNRVFDVATSALTDIRKNSVSPPVY